MTSKENLKKIKEFNSVGLTAESSLFEIVEKDLEVLEELKKDNLIIYLIQKEIYDMKHAYYGNTNKERNKAIEYIERLEKIKERLEYE